MRLAKVGVLEGVPEDRGHLLQAHDLDGLVPLRKDFNRQLLLPAIKAVADIPLHYQPGAVRRQLVHEVHDDRIKDGQAQHLQGNAGLLLLCRDGWILIPWNSLQHLHWPTDVSSIPCSDGQPVLKHEDLPPLPPHLFRGQVTDIVVDHRRSASSGRPILRLLPRHDVDRVRDPVGHGDQALVAEGAVFDEFSNDSSLRQVQFATSPEALFELVEARHSLGGEQGPQLFEHALREHLGYGDVLVSWVFQELLHALHQVEILRVFVGDPVLEGVVVHSSHIPCERGDGRHLRRFEVSSGAIILSLARI
mmetsp:Transcript_107433/g.310513  ORF Transcript_107433/g.310513 Transcript_107433/m.310513 type:complete len:306 (-) Transcript_107433:123-1040(-)